jgi:hypothetical protein
VPVISTTFLSSIPMAPQLFPNRRRAACADRLNGDK